MSPATGSSRRPRARPHRRPARCRVGRGAHGRLRAHRRHPRGVRPRGHRRVPLRAPARRRGLPRRRRLRPRHDDGRGRAPARPHAGPQRVPHLGRRVLPVRHRPDGLRPVLRRRVERPRGLRGQPRACSPRGGRLLRHVPPQGRDRRPGHLPADGRHVRRRHRPAPPGDARVPRRAPHDRRPRRPSLRVPPARPALLRRLRRAAQRHLAHRAHAATGRGGRRWSRAGTSAA